MPRASLLVRSKDSQTNVMVFLMHSEQGPPCISALSHFTRRNRHESQALRDGRKSR